MEEQNGEHRPTDPAASGDPAGEPGTGDDRTSSTPAADPDAYTTSSHRADPTAGAGGGAVTQHGVTTYLSATEYQKYLTAVQGVKRQVIASFAPPVVTPLMLPILPGHVTYVGAGGGASNWRMLYGTASGPMNHAWDTGGHLKAIEDAGIKVGEIIAWRCWSIENGMLKSVAADAMWPTTEPMTGDVSTAGVHAWKTERGALEYGRTTITLGVIGKVAMWGEVIEHEEGYRAEFAKIVSIDYGIGGTSSPDSRIVRPVLAAVIAALRRTYGVSGSMPVPDLLAPKTSEPHSAVPAVWKKATTPQHPFRGRQLVYFVVVIAGSVALGLHAMGWL